MDFYTFTFRHPTNDPAIRRLCDLQQQIKQAKKDIRQAHTETARHFARTNLKTLETKLEQLT